jgi:hypothetical protein
MRRHSVLLVDARTQISNITITLCTTSFPPTALPLSDTTGKVQKKLLPSLTTIDPALFLQRRGAAGTRQFALNLSATAAAAAAAAGASVSPAAIAAAAAAAAATKAKAEAAAAAATRTEEKVVAIFQVGRIA